MQAARRSQRSRNSSSPFVQRAGSRPTSKSKSRKGSASKRSTRKVTTSMSEINSLMAGDATIIPMGEFRRMQSEATVVTKEEMKRRRMATDAKFRERSQRAEARKKKMLKMERERKKRAPQLTAAEIEANDKNREILTKAKRAMDSQWDDVKHMNSMMQYAKCVTIRDAQILEKQQIQDELAAEERLQDMKMEIERVRNIKMTQRKEQLRAKERKAGAAVLVQQIQAREAERIRQQEQREQEAKVMVERIRALELREEEERKVKAEAGRRMLEEVLAANAEQAKQKLRKKQEEIAEDLQIAEYIRQKELREQHMEREAARIAAEKEKEIGRLRALQEKAQDRQSHIDELRAKRYQEQHDRAWRQEQLQIARKKEAGNSELRVAREQQRRDKRRQMAEQALQEREDYYRTLEWQKKKREVELIEEQKVHVTRRQHRDVLLDQINAKQVIAEQARERFLTEGRVVSRAMAADVRRLQRLKDEKLANLARAGVPEKYRAELAKKKLLVPSIH